MVKQTRSFPRNLSRLLMVASILCVSFIFSLTMIRAQEGAQLVFDPPIADLAATAVTVTVRIENVTDLYGIQLDLLYDPSVVVVEAIAPADFLSADFLLPPQVNQQQGTARLVFTQRSPQEPRSGSGALALIRLRAKECLGESPLRLTNVILSDMNGTPISHTLQTGQVRSGVAPANRQISGSIFHDANEDGQPTAGEQLLGRWPIFLQRLSIEPIGPERFTFSQPTGAFQFDDVACGRYQLWTQNGEHRVLTQTVDLSATVDINLDSLPLTGTLDYPWTQIFLPSLTR